MVRRQGAHGGAAEESDALELAAVEQHLTEARVVGGRAGEPAPPASFGGTVTSSSSIGLPVALSVANGCASRAALSFVTRNAVSLILSGVKTRSLRSGSASCPTRPRRRDRARRSRGCTPRRCPDDEPAAPWRAV